MKARNPLKLNTPAAGKKIQPLVNAQTHVNRAVFESNTQGRADYLLGEVEAALAELKIVRKKLLPNALLSAIRKKQPVSTGKTNNQRKVKNEEAKHWRCINRQQQTQK